MYFNKVLNHPEIRNKNSSTDKTLYEELENML